MNKPAAKKPWPKGRKRPYTARGILRLKCIRCGAQAVHQWSVCADGNVQRPLCLACDIAINALVLRWMRDPDYKTKIAKYYKS